MSSNDAAYQLALQKNKSRLPVDRASRLAHIAEEMAHHKKRLLELPHSEQTKTVDRLIALRAEQTALCLEELHDSSPFLVETKTKTIIAAFYADCAKLMAATNNQTNG